MLECPIAPLPAPPHHKGRPQVGEFSQAPPLLHPKF